MMRHYKVTGKAIVTHNCNCRLCTQPSKETIDLSVVVQVAEDDNDEVIQEVAIAEAYREMGLIDETDNLTWDSGQEVFIRAAYEHEIMIFVGAPRLPGF